VCDGVGDYAIPRFTGCDAQQLWLDMIDAARRDVHNATAKPLVGSHEIATARQYQHGYPVCIGIDYGVH
jgi:hypothetical protein